MHEQLELRVATASDLETVLDLLAAQFSEHDIELPGQALRLAVAALFDRDDLGFFVVACDGAQTVGLAAVSFAWTLEHGGRSAWLDELYVLPERRAAGIGTALLREAVRHAAATGCAAVDLEVDRDHRRAEALYAREGFSPLPRSRWVRPLGQE
ncbi:MAG TPA: GNAT family N-acetyltransferase [Anaerolineae bacterium]|nr:GNAT family N-acetyltransferase [Anaerolineae bacterium]